MAPFGGYSQCILHETIGRKYSKNKEGDKTLGKAYMANQKKQLKEFELILKKIYSQNNTGIFIEEELKEVQENELKREELYGSRKEITTPNCSTDMLPTEGI